MKISVIVPVYNAAQYLKECLNSIITQDYDDLEIILINDGSTDNSGSICDNYAQIDNRIIVIHQKNQGVASARNNALNISSGELISFIDADDWINQGMYSFIIDNYTENIDVILLSYPNFKTANSDIKIYSKEKINNNLIPQFIGSKKISLGKMAVVWSICVRKRIIQNILFQNITMTEDKIFFIEVLLKANTLLNIPHKFYNYRINPNSITRSYNKNYSKDITASNFHITQLLKKYNVESKKLIQLHNNTIICFYLHIIKNEAKNIKLILPNSSLDKYYIDNNIAKLLTWKKVIKEITHKPNLLFIKLGLSNYVLKKKWKKYHPE